MKEILEILKHAFYREKGDMPLIRVTATELSQLMSSDLRSELILFFEYLQNQWVSVNAEESENAVNCYLQSRPDSKYK